MTANHTEAPVEDTQAPETGGPQGESRGLDDLRDRRRSSSLEAKARPGDHYRLDTAAVRARGGERAAGTCAGRARPAGEVTR